MDVTTEQWRSAFERSLQDVATLRVALGETTRQRDELLVMVKEYRDEFHNNVIDINKRLRRSGLNDD